MIFSVAEPFKSHSGIAVLRGNLCPDGAVIKPSAAEPRLLKHRGRAVVFENQDDLNERVDDPGLDIDADSVMVLKNCGPKGFPGMPELGMMPIPAKLLAQGVTDMVRISDARMSGTSFGAVVLHVSPKRPPAARWTWSGMATSSNSTWPSAGSICSSPTTNCESGSKRGKSPNRRPPGATRSSTSTP